MVGSKKEYLGSGNKQHHALHRGISANGVPSGPQIEFGGVLTI